MTHIDLRFAHTTHKDQSLVNNYVIIILLRNDYVFITLNSDRSFGCKISDLGPGFQTTVKLQRVYHPLQKNSILFSIAMNHNFLDWNRHTLYQK